MHRNDDVGIFSVLFLLLEKFMFLWGGDMSGITNFVQIAVAVIVGIYFLSKIKSENMGDKNAKNEYKAEAEEMNRLRHIRLNEPMNEMARPGKANEIIGQEEGMRALRAALWGKNPQHIIIYGPPGVGKTAAARVILEEVKNSPESPFKKDAPFIETDAAIMRCDERGFADPLIGSVHDPIYQGSGAFGVNGIPQPKPGAVTRAHGGVLFLDEIGELPNEQLNKLLKVLEDRRVTLESAYYNSRDKKIPIYIKEIFDMGLPADFRLIGATTVEPSKIPEAVRTRCVEVYFNSLSRSDIIKIVINAATVCHIAMERGVKELIADFAKNGRDAVKILQSASNLAKMEDKESITLTDTEWVINAGKYKRRNEPYLKENEKIIDVSLLKPNG